MTHRWLDKLKDEPLMQDESSKKHAFRDIQWLNFALHCGYVTNHTHWWVASLLTWPTSLQPIKKKKSARGQNYDCLLEKGRNLHSIILLTMLAKQLAWMATKDNNLGNPFRVTLSCFMMRHFFFSAMTGLFLRGLSKRAIRECEHRGDGCLTQWIYPTVCLCSSDTA